MCVCVCVCVCNSNNLQNNPQEAGVPSDTLHYVQRRDTTPRRNSEITYTMHNNNKKNRKKK